MNQHPKSRRPGCSPRTGEPGATLAPPQHHEFVDALRGIAILGVICHHLLAFVPPPDRRLATLAQHGFEGVQLFFVMSAFTLFLSLDSRRKTEIHPYADFFIRRFFRIAPLFYAGILFYGATGLLGQEGGGPARSDLGCVLATLTFTNGFHGGWINTLVPGGWSIAVEMNFYLLVPLLFRVLLNFRRALYATFLALMGAALANLALEGTSRRLAGGGWQEVTQGLSYYWLPTHMPIFCLGILLFFLLRPSLQQSPERNLRRMIDGCFVLCLSLYLFVATAFSDLNLYLGHLLFGVTFVLLAWSLKLYPNPLLVNPATRYLGKVSYSAYITHFAVLRLVQNGPCFSAGTESSISPNVLFFSALLMTVAFTLVVSTVTYQFIELPGIRLGRQLIRRLESDPRGSGTRGDRRRTMSFTT